MGNVGLKEKITRVLKGIEKEQPNLRKIESQTLRDGFLQGIESAKKSLIEYTNNAVITLDRIGHESIEKLIESMKTDDDKDPSLYIEILRQIDSPVGGRIAAELMSYGEKRKEINDQVKIEFLTAAQNGDHSTVKRLVLRYPSVVNAKAKESMTALHYAAGLGQTRVAEILIKGNADVNAANRTGWTPLHFAADRGEEQIVQLLLENGAKPDSRDAGGVTPAGLAKNAGHERIASLLDSKAGGRAGEDLILLKQAIEAMKNNRTDEGVKALKEAIEINPKLAKAHQLMAMHYIGIQDGESAKKHFEILRSLDEKLTQELLDTPFGPLFQKGCDLIHL